MSEARYPASVLRLLWDVEPETIDPDRDRALILERVMSRGTWEAMVWLRTHYSKEQLAEFVTHEGTRRLSPRDRSYWALVCDVDMQGKPGGGRPGWAGP